MGDDRTGQSYGGSGRQFHVLPGIMKGHTQYLAKNRHAGCRYGNPQRSVADLADFTRQS